MGGWNAGDQGGRLEQLSYVYVFLAGGAAGLINALAGGGTLLSFPVLLFLGLPAVSANVTNTVALCPGYLGAFYAQRADLAGQRRRMALFLPAAVVGGIGGGVLLLVTSEKLFQTAVPFLILLAAVLITVQEKVKAALARGAGGEGTPSSAGLLPTVAVGLASVYGGYFGAGLSVIVLAVLGLTVHDSLKRLNALKQGISFAANVAAALLFLFSGQVRWLVALFLALGALAGGAAGGTLAARVKPGALRAVIVVVGVLAAAIYFFRK